MISKDKFLKIAIEVLYNKLYRMSGIPVKTLEELFDISHLLNTDKKQSENLSIKIEELSSSLSKSAELMSDIEIEFERQKEIADKWKEEAKAAQIITSMTKEEIETVSKLFGGQIQEENKKSSKISWMQNLIFCILGIVGGFLVSKYLL